MDKQISNRTFSRNEFEHFFSSTALKLNLKSLELIGSARFRVAANETDYAAAMVTLMQFEVHAEARCAEELRHRNALLELIGAQEDDFAPYLRGLAIDQQVKLRKQADPNVALLIGAEEGRHRWAVLKLAVSRQDAMAEIAQLLGAGQPLDQGTVADALRRCPSKAMRTKYRAHRLAA